MTTFAATGVSGFIGLLAGRRAKFRRRRARIDELRLLEPGELERLAQDAGLTFADLLDLAKRDGESAELLGRRLATLGIDSARIDKAVLRDMQRCCSQCESKELCEHELEDQPKDAAWPSYCPNEQTLAALQDMKCH